jgi:RNA polymerase sigma-70 factor (ECF subfamily)
VATSDAELMDQVREGDTRAFTELVDRYADPLVAYLHRLCDERGRAEDLAQETFLQVFRTAERYQERGKLSAYLYRIATNLANSAMRRRNRRAFLRRWFLARDPNGETAPRPDEDLEQTERQKKVGQAIAALPIRLRVPLVLHEIEGLPIAKVAEATRVRPGTVKSRIHRGRQLLKKSLKDIETGGGACRTRSSAKS